MFEILVLTFNLCNILLPFLDLAIPHTTILSWKLKSIKFNTTGKDLDV